MIFGNPAPQWKDTSAAAATVLRRGILIRDADGDWAVEAVIFGATRTPDGYFVRDEFNNIVADETAPFGLSIAVAGDGAILVY
jgi:hypothetical protein